MVPYRFTQSFLVNVTAEPRPRCVVTMTTVGYGDKVWWWVGMSWLWPTCFPKCGGFLWKFQEPQVDELFLGLVEVVEGLQGSALWTTVQDRVKVLKKFMIWRCWHVYKHWHTWHSHHIEQTDQRRNMQIQSFDGDLLWSAWRTSSYQLFNRKWTIITINNQISPEKVPL